MYWETNMRTLVGLTIALVGGLTPMPAIQPLAENGLRFLIRARFLT
jgi:hypothetical protein